MSLLNGAREVNQNAMLLSGKFFRGIVVDNEDPLKLARIKVRVDGIHKDDINVPWSMCALNYTCASGVGGLNIPEVGSQVWVLFCSDDLYSSLYFGASYSKDVQVIDELLEDYPNCMGWSDSQGNLFIFNKVKGFLRVELVSGASFTFDNNGLTVNTADVGPGINETGLNINVQGNANINATNAVKITGSDVIIEGKNSVKITGKNSLDVSSQATNINTTNYTLTASSITCSATGSFTTNCTGAYTVDASSLALGGSTVMLNGLPFMSTTIVDTNLTATTPWMFNCFGAAAPEQAPPQVIPTPQAQPPVLSNISTPQPPTPEPREEHPITIKPNISV